MTMTIVKKLEKKYGGKWTYEYMGRWTCDDGRYVHRCGQLVDEFSDRTTTEYWLYEKGKEAKLIASDLGLKYFEGVVLFGDWYL